MDEKGRILLPLELRKRMHVRRFQVTVKGNKIELEPIQGLAELKGKYRDLIGSEWEELEEKGEDLVDSGRR